MFQFTLFRIPVRVEPWHWLILGLMGSMGRSFDNRADIIGVLVFMMAGFFSILVHEMGHALTGRHFGARDTEVVLHGMGGVAIFPHARFTRPQSFLTTFAGPGIQLVLGVIAFLLYRKFGYVEGLGLFLWSLYVVSIFWALLNCVPVWPMDGGQMLHAILGERKVALTHQIGMIAGIIFAILGFKYGTFIGFLFAYLAYQNYEQYKAITGWRR
ncbi:M50 family metallopeptidase [Verrucomicrobiaceae bacterium 227]